MKQKEIDKAIRSLPNMEDATEKKDWRNKRTRWLAGHRKLMRLYDRTKDHFAYTGAWMDENGRIRRYSYHQASVRRMFNRRFRHRWKQYRYDTVANGNAYRRHEEYVWAIV